MSTPTPETAGRDSRGRFTQGNKGGPGNPHARAFAQRRAAILEVVSADDIKDVFRQLLLLAKAGNLSATKLLLLYAVGKPEPQTDPDRLDEDEFDVLKGQAADPGEMTEIMANIPGETACNLIEAFLPIRRDHFLGQLEKLAPRAAAAPEPASPIASAPETPRPVASAPEGCANDSASPRAEGAAPHAGVNPTPHATGSVPPRATDSPLLTPEQFRTLAEQVLRQAANKSTPEIPPSTDRKRCETAKMRASERHDSLPLDLLAQPRPEKPPSPHGPGFPWQRGCIPPSLARE